MLRPLTDTFGLETLCFGCDPTNPRGLGLRLFWDTERDVVVCSHTFGPEHSGAPTLVHGGALAAMCDEVVAWSSIALAHRFSVTAELRVQYLDVVRTGEPIDAVGRLIGGHASQLWFTVTIRRAETVLVRAEARTTAMGDRLQLTSGVGDVDATLGGG